jgi:hypothetical protein
MNNALRAKLTKRLKNAFSDSRGFNANTLRAILIDIRDLLELLAESARYKALKFHCDWILHPKLTGPRAQRIIKAVDVECVKTMERRGLQDWPESVGSDFFGPLSQDFMDGLLSRFTFHDFESELCEFLERHDIAKLASPWSSKYHGFELVYCQLVEDRTLEYTNKKDPTKYVNRVRVQMLQHRADGSTPAQDKTFPFFLSWTFLWNDQSRLIFQVEFLTKRGTLSLITAQEYDRLERAVLTQSETESRRGQGEGEVARAAADRKRTRRSP